jgi:two-component system cell cycle sensor histidine kinase/response regulator CckA
VLLDLTVRGGMGGRSAIAKLLKIDPQVCAIVSSGYSDDPVMSDHASFGFRAAIAKPFRRTELAHLLEQLLHDVEPVME